MIYVQLSERNKRQLVFYTRLLRTCLFTDKVITSLIKTLAYCIKWYNRYNRNGACVRGRRSASFHLVAKRLIELYLSEEFNSYCRGSVPCQDALRYHQRCGRALPQGRRIWVRLLNIGYSPFLRPGGGEGQHSAVVAAVLEVVGGGGVGQVGSHYRDGLQKRLFLIVFGSSTDIQ